MQTARVTVLKKNKQLVELFGLYDHLAGTYLNSASDLSATLKDANAAVVTGFSAIALAYVTGSQGDYRGAVDVTVDPAPGSTYTLFVESTTTGINFQIPATVKARTTE